MFSQLFAYGDFDCNDDKNDDGDDDDDGDDGDDGNDGDVEEVCWCLPQFVSCSKEFLRQNVVSPEKSRVLPNYILIPPNFRCEAKYR